MFEDLSCDVMFLGFYVGGFLVVVWNLIVCCFDDWGGVEYYYYFGGVDFYFQQWGVCFWWCDGGWDGLEFCDLVDCDVGDYCCGVGGGVCDQFGGFVVVLFGLVDVY